MLAASFISENIGIMTKEDRQAHDELVRLLGVQLPVSPNDELKEQVWKRVCGDNKRGYIPLRFAHLSMLVSGSFSIMNSLNHILLSKVYLVIIVEPFYFSQLFLVCVRSTLSS